MVSRSSRSPLVSSFLLVRSSCRSAWTSLPPRDRFETLETLVGQNADLVGQVLLQLFDLLLLDALGTLVLFLALAREDTDIHDRAFDTRGARERSIAHIAGLFTEDGAQQVFFGRKLSFALRRYFAD